MSALSGKWYNAHGSELDLDVSPDGRLSGTFRSGVGLAARGEAYPVTGFTHGELVSFCVGFGRCDSVTSWAGHLVTRGDENVLQAMWHMAVAPPAHTERKNLWKGTWAGADTFRREAPAPEQARAEEPRPSHPVTTA